MTCLAAFGMILLMQGPAMLTQEIAWVRMLIDYSGDTGVARAVVDTFGGQRPCELCELAERIRNGEEGDPAEERSEQRQRLAWAEMLPATTATPACFRTRIVAQAPARPRSVDAMSRGERPPVPPPRLV
jgi:hypothetical protein